MNLSEAASEARKGHPIARRQWEESGDGSVLIFIPGRKVTIDREPMKTFLGEGAEMVVHPHFDRLTAFSDKEPQCVIGYTFSQDDIMADDWIIAE